MNLGEQFSILMTVFLLLILLMMISKKLISKLFIKLNYKYLIRNGMNCKYEDIVKESQSISECFNLMPGDFKIIYKDNLNTIIKINNVYYSFNGYCINFLFCEECLVNDKLQTTISTLKKQNEEKVD